ncbi:MAG: methyltransferase type 12, partial [Pedobacter sp.]
MINNYDKIANQYDTLSRLVFFKSQVNAQINQLHNIPKDSSVLIVGGGTGWILEEIVKLHPSGIKIIYVEISAKML